MNWDKPTLERFINARDNATKLGHEVFVFQGEEYLVSFAKYLINYLETKLKLDKKEKLNDPS